MTKTKQVTIGFITVLIIVLLGLVVTHLSVFAHEGEHHQPPCWKRCSTPTPTPTIVVTPTPEQFVGTGVSDGRSDGSRSSDNTPPQPTCNFSFAAPILQGFSESNGVQTYSWWLSTDPGITKQSIVYGYAPGDEKYGQDNLPASQTSIAIQGLDTTKTSWAQVWAWKGNCVAKSNWFN